MKPNCTGAVKNCTEFKNNLSEPKNSSGELTELFFILKD